eukprot:4771528-Amphidinium_carterae.1
MKGLTLDPHDRQLEWSQDHSVSHYWRFGWGQTNWNSKGLSVAAHLGQHSACGELHPLRHCPQPKASLFVKRAHDESEFAASLAHSGATFKFATPGCVLDEDAFNLPLPTLIH